MAIFTTNSVRHFYVLKTKQNSVEGLTNAGDYLVSTTQDGKKYFQYMGEGGLIFSDLIDPKTITHIKYTAGEGTPTSKITVTLPEKASIVAGQDYVIRIKVLSHYSPAQEAAMFQFGVVHANNDMVKTPKKFWEALAKSLNANLNKGEEKLFDITVPEAGTSLEIKEIAQTKNYKRGSISVKPVNFEVYTSESTLYFAGEEGSEGYYETMLWGETNREDSTPIPNAYKIADMEHFYHGERGDVYRDSVAKIGWDTKYMINDFSVNYNTLDIHFAFVDTGTESYRSEKDIILVSTNSLTALETEFKTAANL
jgi:hypothetical protein